MKKEILRQLKSDYEKLEIEPSRNLWSRMEFEKDKMPDLSPEISFLWWKYAAVVLFLMSFGSLFYFNSNRAEKKHVTAKNSNSAKPTQATSNVEIISSNVNHTENNIGVISNENNINNVKQNEKVVIISQKSLPINNSVVTTEEEVTISDFSKNSVTDEKIANSTDEKPLITERRKANYIKAEELLLGRELDKTRKESHEHHKTFGVLDMEKIKIQGPASFKILGMTVFADSSETK